MTIRAWPIALMTLGCVAPEPREQTPEMAVAQTAPPVTQPERSWRPLTHEPQFGAAQAILLTDGTVMVQQIDTENWWRLTPDITGSYGNGTWSQRASLPQGFSPLYYASAVLPDGRVIIGGGEYIAGQQAFSKRVAIYDPVADSWREIPPPTAWNEIGDASGIVLANGTFLLSDCCTKNQALFDANSFVWTPTGGGKIDINDEEGWTLLRDGTIFTIDTNNVVDLTQAELYDPVTGSWSSAGDTPIQITDIDVDGDGSHEIGPAPLLYDGTVLAIGANGHNVIYDPSTTTWTQAPDLPIIGAQLDEADGPAALLPNGSVLLAASAGVFGSPTYFFEWDGATFTEVSAPKNAQVDSSYQNFMLLLPTGELMLTDFSADVEIYTPAHGAVAAAVPVVLTAPALVTAAREGSALGAPPVDLPTDVADVYAATLYLGRSFTVTALRPDGISEGSYYGDDQQSPTNYPLVRITNGATSHVWYCRTYAHSTRSIALDARGSLQFDVPADVESGPSTIEVIANGIASPAVAINVR